MDIAYWRQKLMLHRQDLYSLDQESKESRSAVELDQTKVGRLSRMDALQGQAMNNAIAARRQQALTRIESALQRIEEGEYGFCLKCGEEIAEKRLELDPAATVCADCAQ